LGLCLTPHGIGYNQLFKIVIGEQIAVLEGARVLGHLALGQGTKNDKSVEQISADFIRPHLRESLRAGLCQVA
jgi:hypothetical protein